MYRIIDEKLHLAACSVADLTIQQVVTLLDQWEHGASIDSLTLFYDDTENLIVLNEDNKNYKTYLSIAEAYLKADSGKIHELADKAPDEIKQTMQVLENALMQIAVHKEYKINMFQHIITADTGAWHFSRFIRKRHGNSIPVMMFCMYNYGVVQGKREERARRRKV